MQYTKLNFEDLDKQDLKSKLETLKTEINTIEILIENDDEYLTLAIDSFKNELIGTTEVVDRWYS